MAKEFAGLIGGISSKTIMRMPASHQAMLGTGEGPFVCRLLGFSLCMPVSGAVRAPNPMYQRTE